MAGKPRRKRYAEWPGATEYERRQARGRAMGLTPSQAAGKPKPGETPVASIRSGLRRLLEGLFGKPKRQPPAPKRTPGVFDGGRGGRPPGLPPAPPPPEEPDDWWRRVPPEESGIPPGPFDELTAFEQIVQNLGLGATDYVTTWRGNEINTGVARDYLYEGWFNPRNSMDDRVRAREQFFDYTDIASADFDWDVWREWYGEAA